MNNLDKYPDAPCYDCLARSICMIPMMVHINMTTDFEEFIDSSGMKAKVHINQNYTVYLDSCKCPELHEYLISLVDDEKMGRFLLDLW